jgi:hypothetical protein
MGRQISYVTICEGCPICYQLSLLPTVGLVTEKIRIHSFMAFFVHFMNALVTVMVLMTPIKTPNMDQNA